MLKNQRLKIYCDGGARGNPGRAACAFVVVGEDGKVIEKKGFYLGILTNNQAEYKGVLKALDWVEENEQNFQKDLEIILIIDSELAVKQLKGLFKVKNGRLKDLWLAIKEKEIKTKIYYQQVAREKNRLADFIVNQTLDKSFV